MIYLASLACFQNAEFRRAQSRVSLYRSTLVDALERFQYLPFIPAQDPLVIAAAAGGNRKGLNRRLALNEMRSCR